MFSTNYTCLGCGKQGQIKAECPSKESKEKKSSKKFEKKGKLKRDYISWHDNDVSSSSGCSSEEEEANLCLMAKDENDTSNVSSCSSVNIENYNKLLEAFKETHEEANRLALLNNRLKGLNNWWKTELKHWKKSWKIQIMVLKI